MKTSLIVALLAVALALSASAWAGVNNYASYSSWPAGQGASSSYSPGWFQNIFLKNASFDTTLTFIDNVSYSWHATFRSWGTYIETHWLSSQTKKAYCRANTAGNAWAACTVYS